MKTRSMSTWVVTWLMVLMGSAWAQWDPCECVHGAETTVDELRRKYGSYPGFLLCGPFLDEAASTEKCMANCQDVLVLPKLYPAFRKAREFAVEKGCDKVVAKIDEYVRQLDERLRTQAPTTAGPTVRPTTGVPTTGSPTSSPTASPTASPTSSPTRSPTVSPTPLPTTLAPTMSPTNMTLAPTSSTSAAPSPRGVRAMMLWTWLVGAAVLRTAL